MADDAQRTFTEGEAYALVDQAVARETAEATGKIEELTAANAALGTQVDTLETEKAAALSRAEAAEQALADYKTAIENEKAREAKRGERLSQVAEVNPVLDLKDENRVARIVAMGDEEFTGYLADMREVASASPTTPPPANAGDPPRQSAGFTPTPTDDDKPKASVAGVIGAGRVLRKGA